MQENVGIGTETRDEYRKAIIKEIISKKVEFKTRGSRVVKKNLVGKWCDLVDNSLADINSVWYNGASIEAALQCMEKLSQGIPIEDVYELIDMEKASYTYFGMSLSGWQNYSITSVVGSYHERGKDFCAYRDDYINGLIAPKIK